MENLSEHFIQTLTAGNLREMITLFVRERGDKGLRRSSLSGILNENEEEIGKQAGVLKKAVFLFAQVEDLIHQYGLQPEAPTAGAKTLNLEKKKFMDALDSLTRSGRLILVSTDQYLHPEHVERVRATLKVFFENHAVLTPADTRDLLGVSRKYFIPLMEYLDGIKFTARTPDGRKLLISSRSS
ncbi:MAG: SelB C-terminal domain-containing protein [Syntrophales bacterium]|jgi:hypothetical protein|nr:SelB C-terminal domain-containing protein [Syntrophales bacterium]